MRGNFSRGIEVDRKRGKKYTKSLIEQGSPILDSDLAAMVDAEHHIDREIVKFLGCERGSTDLGFFVTSGQLLAHFDPKLGTEFAGTGTAEISRDYGHKYLDRLPGLKVSGSGGSVRIDLRNPITSPQIIRFWVKASEVISTSVGGQTLSIPQSTTYVAVDLNFAPGAPGITDLVANIVPDKTFWIALIETYNPSGSDLEIHYADGSFEIDGVIVKTDGGSIPEPVSAAGSGLTIVGPGLAGAGSTAAAAPVLEMSNDSAAALGMDGAGLATTGTSVSTIPMPAGSSGLALAYLEIFEQFISEIDDPGIIEQALGGDVHTSLRTEMKVRIRLAKVDGLSAQQVLNKDFKVALPSGRVKFGVSTAALTLDPCDLPVPGGYTGPENRLYLLSVHSSSGSNTEFKWSRNNGAQNYPAYFPNGFPFGSNLTSIRIPSGVNLRTGDLIELYSDATTYGDENNGTYRNNGLTRPKKLQGKLCRLGESVADGTYKVFNLLDKNTHAPITTFDSSILGQGQLKIVKWEGLLTQTGTANISHELEHGIVAEIRGEFEPGDSWQYEVRTNVQNANGPIKEKAHGNERLFAPLGLFQQTPNGQPAKLLGWLDSRFPKLCELHADNISFDNSFTGSASDTVQEALDELFTIKQEVLGCGEIIVNPGDDIQAIIDSIPDDQNARLCLAKGIHEISQPLNIQNKREIIIGGNGRASLLRNRSGREIIKARDCIQLDLRDFIMKSENANATRAQHLVRVSDCVRFSAERISIHSPNDAHHGSSGIRIEGTTVSTKTKIVDCQISVGDGDTGLSIINVHDSIVRDNYIYTREKPRDIVTRLQNANFMGLISRLLMDHIRIEEISVEPPGPIPPVIPPVDIPPIVVRPPIVRPPVVGPPVVDPPIFRPPVVDPGIVRPPIVQPGSIRTSTTNVLSGSRLSIGLTTADIRNILANSGASIAIDPTRPIGVSGLSSGDLVTKSRNTAMGAYIQSTVAQWGQYRISFYASPLFSATDWQRIIEANPIPNASRAPIEFLQTELNRFRRELVRAIFGQPSSARLPTSVLGPASIFASTIASEYEFDVGHTGIRVGISKGLHRNQRLRGRVRSILADESNTAHISGNRVSGFAKGIHVGSSNGWGTNQRNPRITFFADEINVERNIVHFPAVAYGFGKDRRSGVQLGSTISATVTGNKVQAVTRSPDDEPPYGNCIVLWGHFGPMISVKNNFCSFGKFGVRVKQLNKDGLLYPGTSWAIGDNAYFGQGTPHSAERFNSSWGSHQANRWLPPFIFIESFWDSDFVAACGNSP